MTVPLVSERPLKVAVLVDTYPDSPFEPSTRDSFSNAVATISPATTVDFYDPIVKQEYPDPSQYDLIALSGGTADINAMEPWVVKMLDFIRNTTQDFPNVKLVGICWFVNCDYFFGCKHIDLPCVKGTSSYLHCIWRQNWSKGERCRDWNLHNSIDC